MKILDILERLIAFDTTSEKSNLELIDFVSKWLSSQGARVTILENETGDKANLWASFGPDSDGGICLSAHSDVVPVTGQAWATDPFRLTRQGNRLFGRGTADMKGFLAVVLALAPEMARKPLKQPIHVALSFDEEVGCTGVGSMIDAIGVTLPRPSMVIVGEPSSMKVVTGHKGLWCFRTVITGKEAHSSQTHAGVSAVMVAARLVSELDLRAQKYMQRRNGRDNGYTPPFTSIHVGRITGGTAFNIIAKSCEFTCDIRNLPGDSGEEIREDFVRWYEKEILPEMQAVDPAANIQTFPGAQVPPMSTPDDSRAETLLRSITGDNSRNNVVYCTEAGLFQNAGLDVVVCGPGSIDQAHKPDEFIEEQQLERCESVVRELVRRCQKH